MVACLVGLGIAVGAVVAGCADDQPRAARADGVVSLSPAMTTILIDLGVQDRLVGRTPWCREIDDRPVVGALDGVDAERLTRLAPSVVVIQPSATGVDPVVLALQERLAFEVVAHRLDSATDVIETIDALVEVGVAESPVVEAHRTALESLARAALKDRGEDAPRVLVLHSVDPFSAAGRNTYLDEVVRAAGAENALERGGWCSLGAEEVVSLDPDIVLLVTGGVIDPGPLETLPWTRDTVVRTLSGPEALEPSTRMPKVVDDVHDLVFGAGS